MKRFPSRVALSVLAVTAVIGLVCGSALAASAATGSAGVGGGAYAGEILVATAWEGEVPDFTVQLGELAHPQTRDVYNYRVAISDGTLVDYQQTGELEELTPEEQSQWYIDAGLAPYEFDWFVYFCPAVNSQSAPDPTPIATNPDINLKQIVFRTVDQVPTFPAITTQAWNDYLFALFSGSLFEPEIEQATYMPENMSFVATPLLNPSDSPTGSDIALAASYLDFECPNGATPAIGRILNSQTPGDYAVERELPVGPTIMFEPFVVPGSPIEVASVPSAGTYVSVIGGGLVGNAALWGVTHINDGVRALPNTGVDSNAAWGAGVGAVMLALAGAALVGIRRKSAR